MFKEAYINLIIKKSGLDSADVRSYRAISNLSVVSKLQERVVSRQLVIYRLLSISICMALALSKTSLGVTVHYDGFNLVIQFH
jgi:hypothetical protein